MSGPFLDPCRIAFEQFPRVGVTGLLEDLAHITRLDDFARIHHHDPVAQLGDNAKVVGNKQDRATNIILQGFQLVDDLNLKGRIKRSRRFIRNQECRLHHQGHRYRYALAHATRQLVRVFTQSSLRVGNTDLVQHLDRPRFFVSARDRSPVLHVVHLATDAQDRVQTGHRILEHHRQIISAYRAHTLLRQGEQILAIKTDLTANQPGVG